MIVLDNLPPDLHAEYTLAYEARAVHDTASLRPAEYRVRGVDGWVVATVQPAPGSGSATVAGAHIDAASGRFVAPPAAAPVVVKQGVWKVLAAAGSGGATTAGARGASYGWTEPLDAAPSRRRDPEGFYSPFAHGGTVVFLPQPQAAGVAQFGACRMVFAEWGLQAAEALQAPPAAPADAAQLAQALAGRNGVLATLALASAIERGLPVAAQAPAWFAAADPRRLSAFVYLALLAPAPQRADWAAPLARVVEQTQQADRLLAMAYAAFAVSLFATHDAAALAAARQLLGLLHRRGAELNLPLAPGAPWTLIFSKSGVP